MSHAYIALQHHAHKYTVYTNTQVKLCMFSAVVADMCCGVLQAEARRRAAAVRIAGWYKRCIETRPARLTLKARRHLLPLTSLDRKHKEEQKAAAAAAILVLLQDIQRGHRFARAVKGFLCKVCCLSTTCTHSSSLLEKWVGYLPGFCTAFWESRVSRESARRICRLRGDD